VRTECARGPTSATSIGVPSAPGSLWKADGSRAAIRAYGLPQLNALTLGTEPVGIVGEPTLKVRLRLVSVFFDVDERRVEMKWLPIPKEAPHLGVTAIPTLGFGNCRRKETDRWCEVDTPAGGQLPLFHLRSVEVGRFP